MSTSAFIHLQGLDTGARIHCDGYPLHVGAELIRLVRRDGVFFAMQTFGTVAWWSHLDSDSPEEVLGYGTPSGYDLDEVPSLDDCEYDYRYEVYHNGIILVHARRFGDSSCDLFLGHVDALSDRAFHQMALIMRDVYRSRSHGRCSSKQHSRCDAVAALDSQPTPSPDYFSVIASCVDALEDAGVDDWQSYIDHLLFEAERNGLSPTFREAFKSGVPLHDIAA